MRTHMHVEALKPSGSGFSHRVTVEPTEHTWARPLAAGFVPGTTQQPTHWSGELRAIVVWVVVIGTEV